MKIFPVLSVILLRLATRAGATEYQAKVVGLYDGDTATVLTNQNKQVKVRLDQIDTPERKQPYGNSARQALADKIFGKVVTVRVADIDRYGRTVALLFLGDRNINLEMVEEGHAWAYRQYVKDRRFISAEESARKARNGLWALQADQVMAPWEWRKAQKNGTASNAQPAVTKAVNLGSFSCGSKQYCKQMASCDEARFHLTQCGLSRLDSDGDGMPCEAICR